MPFLLLPPSPDTYNWPYLEQMQVAFYSDGEITQVKESRPWVRCAVLFLCFNFACLLFACCWPQSSYPQFHMQQLRPNEQATPILAGRAQWVKPMITRGILMYTNLTAQFSEEEEKLPVNGQFSNVHIIIKTCHKIHLLAPQSGALSRGAFRGPSKPIHPPIAFEYLSLYIYRSI